MAFLKHRLWRTNIFRCGYCDSAAYHASRMTGGEMRRKQIAGMNQNYRQYSYSYFLDSMNMAEYESVELWLGAPHVWVDSQGYYETKKIREQTQEAGLEIVSVTTPSGGAFQYQYAAQEKMHRERSIAYFQNGVRMTAELGARIMTVNSGWGYWNDAVETATARSVEILGEVCKTAEKEGILIALESLTKDESLIGYTIDQVQWLIKMVDSPVLKAMVDLDATWYSKESAELWFQRFGNDLVHFHFQDGDIETPSAGHYVWGEGDFCLDDEVDILNKHNYSGILTQEICGSDDPRQADVFNMQSLSKYLED